MGIQKDNRFFAEDFSVSATVATIPVGCTLGEERISNGVTYKLCYNAGTAAIPQGHIASPMLANCTPASVAVSTLSRTQHHIGGVVACNTSVSAGLYFWGARKGVVGGMVGDAASLPTGSYLIIGAGGTVTLCPASAVTGAAFGIVITTVSNGGTATGNCYVSFP